MNYSLFSITIIALNIALFVMVPVLGNKILDLWGVTVMGGTIAMTFSNGLVDVINNAHGLQVARRVVLAGAIVRALVWLIVLVIVLLPAQSQTPGFDKVASGAFRLLLAGEVSHIVGQYFIDAPIFDWVRRKMKAGFWLRYNVSNFISYTLGNTVFVLLALAGTGKPIMSVILGTAVWRFLASAAITPIFALLSRFATKAAAAAALVFALYAFPANATQEWGPITFSSNTRLMYATGAYPAHGEEVALVTYKDLDLWVLDLFNWDRTVPTSPKPINSFNNRMIMAWTPLWCLGPEAEWQVITGNTPIWRGGLACRYSNELWGFRFLTSTTATFSTGDYNYAVGEFFNLKHVETRLFLQDVFMWWFGGGNYRVNNKLTFGWEVVPNFAVIGQVQTVTNTETVWRWGIQGNI